MPTLTMTPDEYEAMQQDRRDALAETEKLRKELVVERGKNGDRRIAELTSAVRLGLEVIRFAVGNLPPESIRGWPWPELQAFAGGLKALPDYTVTDDELRGELERFANECAKHEQRRANMPVKPIVDADQVAEMRASIELANSETAKRMGG